jgi:hypothetical protein
VFCAAGPSLGRAPRAGAWCRGATWGAGGGGCGSGGSVAVAVAAWQWMGVAVAVDVTVAGWQCEKNGRDWMIIEGVTSKFDGSG